MQYPRAHTDPSIDLRNHDPLRSQNPRLDRVFVRAMRPAILEVSRPMRPRILRFGPAALAVAATLAFLASPALAALEECRLLRQPDIQGDRIVFVYGGDLWTVARSGGVASRLTSHEGVEVFPKFSPDGKT